MASFQSSSPQQQQPRVCKFFLQGRCTNGANCRFSHARPSFNAGAGAVPRPPYRPSSSQPLAAAATGPRQPVCTYFLQNRCTSGSSCRFLHQLPSSSSSVPRGPPPGGVCKFYQQGKCTNANCRFLHTGPVVASPFPCPPAAPRRPPLPYEPTWREKVKSAAGREVFSIDVECVASGFSHRDRVVGRIAMVNSAEELVYDVVVDVVGDGWEVKSYMTKLTGLTEEMCAKGVPLKEAVEGLKEKLPKEAVLVGQGIHHDIEWVRVCERAKGRADRARLRGHVARRRHLSTQSRCPQLRCNF